MTHEFLCCLKNVNKQFSEICIDYAGVTTLVQHQKSSVKGQSLFDIMDVYVGSINYDNIQYSSFVV